MAEMDYDHYIHTEGHRERGVSSPEENYGDDRDNRYPVEIPREYRRGSGSNVPEVGNGGSSVDEKQPAASNAS